jgi:ubiquinone/menaquinone biosynthesis C-methylase UbiE
MILDVGCGSEPHGDVNCDLFTGLNPHLIGSSRRSDYVIPREIPNFVKATIYSLPFKTSGFSTVVCYHVLEHLEDPLRGLQELKRVSKRFVIVRVPSLRAVLWGERATHLFTWSEYSLSHFLSQIFSKITIHSSYAVVRGKILSKIPYMRETLIRMLQHFINQELVAICEV